MAGARRYEFGPFQLNPDEGTLVAGGEPVALAPKPFDVLRLLVERHGHVVLKSELMATIWPDTAVEDANLTVSVSVLRKALEQRQPGTRFIETLPKRGYRFVAPVRESAGRSAIPPTTARAFVGRERELATLRNALGDAASGTTTFVSVSGEPGIGKTTLIEHFLDQARHGEPRCFVARGRCLEHLAGVDAFLPILQALNGLILSHECLSSDLQQHAPAWHAAIETTGAFGSQAAEGAPPMTTPAQLRVELTGFLQQAARGAPVAFFIDDLHWSDASTIDLLGSLLDALAPASARILIVAAYRPSELLSDGHPFFQLQRKLQARGIGRDIGMGLLSRREIEAYLAARFSRHRLPATFVDALYRTTEGNPLFMVDLVRDLVRRGVVAQDEHTWALSGTLADWHSDAPRSVRAMMERTVRQLEPGDRTLLSAASLQGLEFDPSILALTVGEDPSRTAERLATLTSRYGIVRPIDDAATADHNGLASFTFVHALHRQALYSALPPTRRALLSGAVAHAILERHRDHASDVASTLALLFESARDYALAAEYALLAAEQAVRLSGYREAVECARRGLSALESVPASAENTFRRLRLLVILAMAVGAVEGHGAPGVREAYDRATGLCRDTSDWLHLVPIVVGMWAFHASRGEFARACVLGSEFLILADQAGTPGLRARGHVMHGGALAHLGQLADARAELDLARREHRAHGDTSQFILDAGVHTYCERAELLVVMGYPDQALASCRIARALGRRFGTPYSLTFAFFFSAVVHRRRGEPVETLKWAEAAIEQSRQHNYLDALSWALALRSWALCRMECVAEGLSNLTESLASRRRMGSNIARAPLLAIQADAYLSARLSAEGLAAVDEAAAPDCEGGDIFCVPELECLRGDLLMLRGGDQSRQQAEESYTRAAQIARSQGARWFELLAATRLCRLGCEDGQRPHATRTLSVLYDTLREGRKTPILVEARRLLESLGHGRDVNTL